MTPLDNLRLSTPIQLLDSNFQNKHVRLFIKRDDLIHPWINGNKWRKLQGHIEHYRTNGYNGIISYGGANSNHLVAVACACDELNIPSVGIVRTYEIDERNPIIQKLRSWNMELRVVSPPEYRQKESSTAIRNILSEFPDHMLIPEGGTSQFALSGLNGLTSELLADPLYERNSDVLLSIGTGGMLAGLYDALPSTHQFIAASPFKSDITYLKGMDLIKKNNPDHIQLVNASGGKRFGAYDHEAVMLINEFYDRYGVLLDPIYTAKAVKWLIDQLCIDERMYGRSILLIHSGGLPGVMAYNYMYESKDVKIQIPAGYDHLQ